MKMQYRPLKKFFFYKWCTLHDLVFKKHPHFGNINFRTLKYTSYNIFYVTCDRTNVTERHWISEKSVTNHFIIKDIFLLELFLLNKLESNETQKQTVIQMISLQLKKINLYFCGTWNWKNWYFSFEKITINHVPRKLF